jgi:hypothetical protein
MTAALTRWDISGSYFEACNCTAICPCRSIGGAPGSRSTYGICEFALSWRIIDGYADDARLDSLVVVLAGWFDDSHEPSSPWTVKLYVDDGADQTQSAALADIFLGRAGGTVFANYGQAIGTIHHVRPARIALSHERRRWRIRADAYVSVWAVDPVDADGAVSCGIPGHDRPGQEVVSDELRVDDAPLSWDVRERCGFASDFHYVSSVAAG